MKKISLKALGSTIIALGMVLAGSAFPAQAAPGVTIDSPMPTFYENSPTPAFLLTLEHTGTIPTGIGALQLSINSLNPLAGCGAAPSPVPSASCGVTSVVANGGGSLSSPTVQKMASDLKFDFTGTTSAVTISFAAGAFTTSTPGTKTLTLRVLGTPYTTTINVLSGSAPVSSTVTFDPNGGTGTTATQTASSATALTANGFTRTGYTFAGWNTAASGSGTAYANGASYPFTSSTTLYAQWTPVLANTGFDGMPFAATGAALLVLGAGVYLFSRRSKA